VNRSKERELESLVALLETKEVLLPHEVGTIWGFEKSTASRYVRDFISEYERPDTSTTVKSLSGWIERLLGGSCKSM